MDMRKPAGDARGTSRAKKSGAAAGGGDAATRGEDSAGKKESERKAAVKKAAKKTASRLTSAKSPDLTRDLRDFAAARPQGWEHDDWESFLGHLRNRGHDTSNADAIGLALERERLALALQQIQGVGPQRVKSLTDRFTTVWNVRNADVEEIASAARIRRDLAERIKTSV
jgi:hypothetical protein